jgi:hypothetical protein
VALTLPEATIRGLKKLHPDLAWAVVTLFEKRTAVDKRALQSNAAELVGIAQRQFLIVVNSALLRRLPGVDIIPLSGNRAFLALEPGRGMADLELAVRDRLEALKVKGPEHRALHNLRTMLAAWRRDRKLRVHTRAIIVLERR